jgi:hypothetical protein
MVTCNTCVLAYFESTSASITLAAAECIRLMCKPSGGAYGCVTDSGYVIPASKSLTIIPTITGYEMCC